MIDGLAGAVDAKAVRVPSLRLRDVIERERVDFLKLGGEFVALHRLGAREDHVLNGTRVHEILSETLPLRRLKSEVHSGFRLDTWIEV